MDIKRVGVIGAGTMGNGIAHVFARGGYSVVLCDVEQRFLERGIAAITKKTSDEMRAGLNDDLNTALALGAIFDMVRDVNAAADAGDVRKDDVPALLKVVEQFEEIFAVLKDDDAAKVRATVEWAKAEGLDIEVVALDVTKD